MPGATSYTVYISTSPITSLTAAGVIAVSNVTTTTTVRNLTNGRRYYVRVVARNAGGQSPASAETSATPAASTTTAPSGPTNLRASTFSTGVRLFWTDVSGPTSYTIYYSTSPITSLTASGVTAIRDVIRANLGVPVTPLPNALHYFVVTATTAGVESRASNQISVTPVTPTAAPAAPTNLRATASNPVVLSWTPAQGAAGFYTVYISTSPISNVRDRRNVTEVRGLGGDTTIAISQLNSNTRYYFRVSARNNAGESSASAETSATPGALTTPGAPTMLRVTPGDGRAGIRWRPAVPTYRATSSRRTNQRYTIYYSTSPITNLTAAGVNSLRRRPAAVVSSLHAIPNLTNDTRYYVRVTVSNGASESPPSNQLSVTPSAAAALPAPTNLRVTPGIGQATLSWTGVSGVGVVYQILRSSSPIPDSGGGTFTTFSPTTTATISLTSGLWYFRVIARNDAGGGSRSTQVSATVR